MRVLDLCTEFASETAAFRDRGHEVVTLGIEGNVDIKCDVRQYFPSIDDKYDFIIAHPPCQQFSLMASFKLGGCKKRKPDLSIVWACKRIIDTLKSRYWMMENPRGCMRYFIGPPQVTILYGMYGHDCLKPTDLWGDFPFFWSETPNTKLPKGSYIKDGLKEKQRSLLPYGLSLALCKAIERDMEQI